MAPSTRYDIRVRVLGELAPTWSTVLSDLRVAAQPDGTTLVTGVLADQAALHGFLGAVRDLGLTLASVEVAAVLPTASIPGES